MKKTFILLAVLLVSFSLAWADIDFLMDHTSNGLGYNSSDSTYSVRLKIRNHDGPIQIGHFNLRILFNNTMLAFNDSLTTFDGPLSTYDPMNTGGQFFSYTGTSALFSSNKCGYNVAFEGGGSQFLAYPLDTTYVDIGTVVFNVISTGDDVDIRWDPQAGQNDVLFWDALYSLPVNSLNGDFHEIIGTVAEVTYPNGGETFSSGTVEQILWTAPALGTIDIEVSYDNMGTWNLIADDIANTGSFDWTVTDQLSTTCHIKVSGDFIGTTYSDVSDAAFTISMNIIAPSNLMATINNLTDVQLNWTAPNSNFVTGYKIYRDNSMIHEITDPATTSYTDAGLAAGTYSYHVTAMYNSNESAPSNSVNAEVEIPYAPTNLQGQVQNDDEVVLTWQMPAGPTRENVEIGSQTTYYGEQGMARVSTRQTGTRSSDQNTVEERSLTGFKVYRDNVMIHQINNPAILTYTDTGLSNDSYVYFVTAVFTAGESTESNRISVDIEAPYAPRNLTYSVNSDDITLNWQTPLTGPTRDLLGYIVYRDDVNIHTVISPDTLTYTDENMANGTYVYKVAAQYTNAVSPQSSPVTVVLEVAYAPQNLTASVVDNNDVQLAWNTPAIQAAVRNDFTSRSSMFPAIASADAKDHATMNTETQEVSETLERTLLHYEIFRNDQSIHTTTTLDDTTYLDTTLANGDYNYYVKAVYSAGTSPQSNTASVSIAVAYAPVNIAYVINENNIKVTWAVPPTNERSLNSFKVYRDNNMIHQTPNADSLSYTDMDLANGSYVYHVVAVYSDGDSQPSETVTAALNIAYAPIDVTYETHSDTVNLYWRIHDYVDTDSLVSFAVYRNGGLIGTVNYTSESDTTFMDNDFDESGTYNYFISAEYTFGTSPNTDMIPVVVTLEANGDNEIAPLQTALSGNYPNPFNPETTIKYSLKNDSKVNITIYNIKGQKVKTLLSENKASGNHEIVWHGKDDSGRNVGSGVYFYRMTTDNFSKISKMTLLK